MMSMFVAGMSSGPFERTGDSTGKPVGQTTCALAGSTSAKSSRKTATEILRTVIRPPLLQAVVVGDCGRQVWKLPGAASSGSPVIWGSFGTVVMQLHHYR